MNLMAATVAVKPAGRKPIRTGRPGLESRIFGCWLGKSIGGTLGIPAEGRMERLHLSYYDPVPTTTPSNDDLELQLVWLDLLEKRGLDLTQSDFADAWLSHIHYMWDEYGRCRWNLRRAVPQPDVGTFENPFQAGMGAPIRSEIWACIADGDADLAARYAALDASLDHGPEGIAGEVFFAVLQTLVLKGADCPEALVGARDAIDPVGTLSNETADYADRHGFVNRQDAKMSRHEALRRIDATTREPTMANLHYTETARAVSLVLERYAKGVEVWRCREQLLAAHNNANFTHAPLNVALTVWALVYGEGDFEKSILLAVNGGYDTDCTAATVGATLGLALGRERIPTRWKSPIGERVSVGPGIRGISAPRTLEELTERTLRLAEWLRQGPKPRLILPLPTGLVHLRNLPGTIDLVVPGSSQTVPWANGELPAAVKRAGGATWLWQVGARLGQRHYLIGLAEQGGRLWIEDELLIDCPAGLPYVPATHRCPAAARAAFTPKKESYRIRVELNGAAAPPPRIIDTKTRRHEVLAGKHEPDDAAWRDTAPPRATVLLASNNLHLAPWSAVELPHPPVLSGQL